MTNATEISDRLAGLMREAGDVKYLDFKSRQAVIGRFMELRQMLLLFGD